MQWTGRNVVAKSNKQKKRPSELEMQFLSVLWENGPLTVRQLHELLRDGKSRAYTTVLATLQTMEKKGLVDHQREGMANVYRPIVAKEKIMKPFMNGLLQNFFSGDISSVVQSLIDSSDPNEDELKAIKKLINNEVKERNQKSGDNQ